jgi:hypothetical protein
MALLYNKAQNEMASHYMALHYVPGESFLCATYRVSPVAASTTRQLDEINADACCIKHKETNKSGFLVAKAKTISND